ncbi:hypothetical protein amrb99_14730 [Actinomadura sp. RB99]|uniref:hypothetical protein n=1 Tax=Actinomadura sp. RB99 TaxID=2691577 RepID=UPI0019C9CB9F|nr:hypothetical protein [Actinomadura sp. RB99]MBD2892563.1 hypothetical protein [Actinomadura sp. RB99]
MVTLTLEQTPPGATHWSRAPTAERTGLSKSAIGRIWRRFDLKPHRADTFKISTDPLFVEKVVGVVGLYHHPPERAVVRAWTRNRKCRPSTARSPCCR